MQITCSTEMVLIEGVGVGKVRLGMSIEDVQAMWGKADEISRSQYSMAVDYYRLGLGITCDKRGNAVTAILALNNRFYRDFHSFEGRTSRGVSVSDTEDDVRHVYGEPLSIEADWRPFREMFEYLVELHGESGGHSESFELYTLVYEGISFAIEDRQIALIEIFPLSRRCPG